MNDNHLNKVYGSYLILEKSSNKDSSNHFLYKCQCLHCGTIEYRSIRNLKGQKGNICIHFDKNGFKRFKKISSLNKRLTIIFRAMKNRCYNKKSKDYKWYGGKGIKICDEWLNEPLTFIIWALNNGYEETLTIDRINSSENYSPNNCRWIELKENSRRAGIVNYLIINGEKLTGRQWSKKIGKGVNFVNRYIKKYGVDYTTKIIKENLGG